MNEWEDEKHNLFHPKYKKKMKEGREEGGGGRVGKKKRKMKIMDE